MKRFLVLAVLAGCTPFTPPGTDTDTDTEDDTDTDTDTEDLTDCSPDGERTCFGSEHAECQGGEWQTLEVCVEPTPTCWPDTGCLVCRPGERTCEGNAVVECAGDGSGTAVVEECGAPLTCNAGACADPCDPKVLQYSYLGCDFLAVTTANLVSPAFDNDFGLVVSNPETAPYPANVTVSRGGSAVATKTVNAGDTVAITLPMVGELKNAQQSVVVTKGAYEVHSDMPIVAYQYNPLHFNNGAENSFTNDASMLLPENTLTGNYLASTWPTWGHGEWTSFFGVQGEWDWFYPGFVAVAATEDGTQVTFTASGATAGGNPGALTAGQSTTVTLNRGDVMQIFSNRPSGSSDLNYCKNQGWAQKTSGTCPPSGFGGECDAYCSVTGADLTGSTVAATAPVAVWAGHMCTFMPYYSWACDHLEEMMPPVETLGSQVVMTAPVHPNGSGVAPTIYRFLAAADGVTVQFDPSSVALPQTLNKGQFLEFASVLDFVVDASGPVLVTQALQGQDQNGGSRGDPAMGTGIPWRQTRTSYDFLTPDSYEANYVNVVAPTGSAVLLDGAPVTAWTAIGGSTFSVARVPLSPGAHHMASTDGAKFGITTYGYASYTSYLYPGGMNFSR